MPVPIERLMRMSAITPLVELRRYLAKNHGVTAEAAAAALREIDETFFASDHEAALELHTLLSPTNCYSMTLLQISASRSLQSSPRYDLNGQNVYSSVAPDS